MSAQGADPRPVHSDTGLAHGSMTQIDVLAQSVAGMAPSAAMATTPALIALYAGNGAWLSYVCATVVVILVGLVATQFGRRFASSGSLYSYVARGLGPTGAFAAGWGLIIGYGFIAMIGVVGAGLYFGAFLTGVGVPAGGTLVVCVILAIVAIGAAAFAIIGIRISTRVGLVLEIISVAAVLLVLIAVLAGNPAGSNGAQFTFSGLSFDGVAFGIVLGVLGFVGFESAASLGAEARNPHRAIPRAVLGSAVLVGILYIFAAYTMVRGFGDPNTLGQSTAPISDLAGQYGLGGVAWIVDLGITASFFAVTIACINASSRILYTMGEEGILPKALGRAHPTHKTPHVAIAVIAPVVLVVPIILAATGVTPLQMITYTGTIGTFGYMLSYVLMAIALPAFLRRRGEFNALSAVLAVVVVAALVYVFYKNVIPVPEYPLNLMPWIFLALVLIGLAWYAAIRARTPQVAEEVGTFEEEPVPPGTVHPEHPHPGSTGRRPPGGDGPG
ncbi:APC family permease [Pseudonocardia benzenivorans]|uniref:Amino acid permease-associated region n=2 Tax=Pseudonocardia TaxID=1847 RepID=F4CTL6_PSEUX|nr:APC family permease [Pseudonocardia dioxanivorans]AEA28519.1 amino acid permease-associated region [Pseudonocardia dioxanivorans CB1190]GJF01984.1 amino acid permease [Pseudonocardia sp. D17]